MTGFLDFLTDPVFAGFLQATTRLGIPILLAALGGMFAERAGVLNIGLEGMMLTGAFVGFVTAFFTGNLWYGVIVGTLSGGVLGAFLAVYTVALGTNQVVAGIAFNLLMVGVTSFAYRVVFGIGTETQRITSFEALPIPYLSDLPVLGPLLFQHTILVYLALVLVPVTWLVTSRMAVGTAITAVGEHPQAAETLGISVARTRTLCLIASGLLAGLGGAFLSLSAIGLFLDNMTAGRGYIALAILLLGRRNPWGILLAAGFFGAADALQLRGQNFGIGVPYQFMVMLPYVLTILVLIGFAGRVRDPAALGMPFRRARAE
jgi:simple sugar transport system permease protein